MSAETLGQKIPSTAVAVSVAFVLVTFVYSILVLQSLLQWVLIMATVLSIILTVFVVYLFYRLVLAVEQIAEEH